MCSIILHSTDLEACLMARSLIAGGGIRDCWNNLVEKTSDAGGMDVLFFFLRLEGEPQRII